MLCVCVYHMYVLSFVHAYAYVFLRMAPYLGGVCLSDISNLLGMVDLIYPISNQFIGLWRALTLKDDK